MEDNPRVVASMQMVRLPEGRIRIGFTGEGLEGSPSEVHARLSWAAEWLKPRIAALERLKDHPTGPDAPPVGDLLATE